MQPSRKPIQILIAACLAFAAGCGGAPASDALTVVATTTVLGDVIAQMVGDEASVQVLLAPGVDPHDFQPSSEQVADVHRADLVVANGLGLEEGLLPALEAASAEGVKVVEIGKHLEPRAFGPGLDCDPAEAGHDHDEPPCDPHVWMDPVRMSTAARLIAAELETIEPDAGWLERADSYAAELEELDREIEAILASVPSDRRILVTNHASLGYFADRYDLEVMATVYGTTTHDEPSSADVAGLVEAMRQRDVEVIFTESTESGDLARAVVEELGGEARTVELYSGSLGDPASEAGTLTGMLRSTARTIATALGGGS